MKIDHNKRNKLTEHECNYKRYNSAIIDGFSGIHPPLLSKLGMVIFNIIIENKRYHKPDSRYYSEAENRRIYSNRYVTLEDILNRCHPAKYNVDGKDMSKDTSNLVKKLQQLEDENIFYMWRYGSPYTYMFILERDMGIWKYYNPLGCVTPKTLKKVVRSNNGIIDTMVKLEKARERPLKLQDIEKSFMKDLIGNLISKMDKSVASKISIWDGEQSLSEYLTILRKELKQLDDYEGLEHHDTFLKRLPRHLANKLTNKAEKEKKMNIAQLSRDLVPDNEDLVKVKATRKRKRTISASGSIQPIRTSFKGVDPFRNCNQFMKFYREVILMYNNNARFYPYDAERIPATQIMDMLIDHGKNGDKDFLRSWIRYYIGISLQGNNAYKQNKTSLLSFQKTFNVYETKHFRG